MSENPFLEQIENLEAKIAVRLDHLGREIPDPEPLVLPSGFRRPETLQEQVRRLVRTSLSLQAAEEGYETFEESEDFNVDDEVDPSTPYEEFFDPALNRSITPQEFERNHEIYKKRYLKAQEEFYQKLDAEGIIQENLFRAARRARQEKSRGADGGGQPPSDSSYQAPKAPPAEQS